MSDIIPFPHKTIVEVPASLLGILVAASFDGAVAARNRLGPGPADEINAARESAMQAIVDRAAALQNPRHPLTAETAVVVCNSDDGHDHETTWGAFCADNIDGLGLEGELPLIASKLAREYRGGGGAEPIWTIRRA
jgi:hypothetical protein